MVKCHNGVWLNNETFVKEKELNCKNFYKSFLVKIQLRLQKNPLRKTIVNKNQINELTQKPIKFRVQKIQKSIFIDL